VCDADPGCAPAAAALEVADTAATACLDGDFLSQHRDDGKHARPNGRVLSFVYWLHRRPRRFTGGALRLCGWACLDGEIVPAPPAVDLEPHHDTLVVFPSATMHEVFPVRTDSAAFADARFAITGFVRRR
jgi:Rps23 Pro-64 3,4-dihydroxylase Tpa1-like proline 4-hydroxylase